MTVTTVDNRINAGGGVGVTRILNDTPDHFADGGNNDCDSIRDFDPTDKETYNFITARATAVPKHHLDLVYAFALPEGFSAFRSTAFEFFFKTIGSSPEISVEKIIDSLGVEQTTGLPTALNNAAKTKSEILASALTGTFTGDTTIYVVIRGAGDTGTPFSGETCLIGALTALVQ